MHNESSVPIKRGRPKGIKDSGKRKPAAPLPESITCEICGTTVKPKTRRQRYCSQACYHLWWNDHVREQASEKGFATQRAAGTRGRLGPRNDKGQLIPVTPKPEPARPLLTTVSVDIDENDAWAERARYWEGIEDEPKQNPSHWGPPRPQRKPLVLNGHGIHLRVHQGALVVRNGFTHYPQDNPEMRFFPGDRKLPSRIIVLDSDGAISFDVMAWLSQQDIPLVVLNWKGEVVSVVGQGGAYAPELRQRQIEAITNGVGLTLATDLIRQKIEGCREVLLDFWKSPGRDAAISNLELALEGLSRGPESYDAIRPIEGRAALAYFTAWQEQPIKWKGIGRKPIPESWHRIGTRGGLGVRNKNATHPLNAMLNYAYAWLESEVRIAALSAGLDPTIGYLHARYPGRLALVYDLMEPLRPEADRHVLALVRRHTFSPSDFVVRQTGVCRLHPELARKACAAISSAGISDELSNRFSGFPRIDGRIKSDEMEVRNTMHMER